MREPKEVWRRAVSISTYNCCRGKTGTALPWSNWEQAEIDKLTKKNGWFLTHRLSL
jgi:hypothetical protein